MVVAVEVVDIDLAVRFEMARDKLTERSLPWKKSGAKPNLPRLWCCGERGKLTLISLAATAEAKQVKKSGGSRYPGMMRR